VRLLANAERVALVMRLGVSLEGIIFTWVGSSKPMTLDRPMVIATTMALEDHTLTLYNDYDKVVGAYDLASLDPPLASLPPEVAVAEAKRELAGEDRLLCDRLGLLDHLGSYWVKVAARRSDELWSCALTSLTESPQPGEGDVLRRLLRENRDVEDLPIVSDALARNDDHETSAALVELTSAPAPSDRHVRHIRSAIVDAAYEQLWRTGRASAYGLCPPQPRAHRVPDLERRAIDCSIGTPHPLLFQRVASDGSWCLLCQARSDTDGDGKIHVMVGNHGETLGDDVRPYLVIGSGPGWTFDEFVAADPKGRYVAVREGACLEIVDTRTPSVLTMTDADLRDDGRLGPHRGAAFDPRGERMLYLRGGATTRLVVRDLVSGRETQTDVGKGLVLDARFDPEGRWIQATTIPSGRWPGIHTTQLPRGSSFVLDLRLLATAAAGRSALSRQGRCCRVRG
jgi:hypothetical protein